MMKAITKRNFAYSIVIVTIVGLVLRLLGFSYEAIDYVECFGPWSEYLKSVGNLRALSEFPGDYNYPYVTILYFLTYLPISPLYSIKTVLVLFDLLEATFLAATVMHMVTGSNRYTAGLIGYTLVLCNPSTVLNAAWLTQCESVWTAFALLAFYLLIVREKPALGMFAFGMALSFKLQALFILPLLLIFLFYKKKYSFLHVLWIPVAMEILCIPAIIGGCGWDCAVRQYTRMMGEYPFMFYYYPNVWTFFRQAPYYVFGTIAIVFTFVVLLIFAVLFVKSGRKHELQSYLKYAAWTSMTCAMLLPCMHERYNYMAEILLPVSAMFDKKLRLPALFLVLVSMQCIGQQYLGWSPVSWYLMGGINVAIYFYLTAHCFGDLYTAYKEREKASC